MKFTIVFTTLLCVSTSWAVLAKKVEDPKDKREAPVGYGSPGLLAHSYQPTSSLSQGDANAISVGAGYSIGGAQPSYNFGGPESNEALQYSAEGLSQLSPHSHGSIQLAPITLQHGHGGAFTTGDLSQFMSQLSNSLNAGGISLQPSTAVAEFHQGAEGVQQAKGSQEYSFPQFSYGTPKQQQFVSSEKLQQQLSSAPAYSSGSKGLGSYSTGPVLFTPSDSQSNPPAASYGTPSSEHSFGDVGSLSLGGGGHSLVGLGLGGSGHNLGGSGLSLGGTGHSLGGTYKHLNGYAAPGKSSFKPSAYLGSSVQGESGHGFPGQGQSSHGLSSHGLSSLSGSYGPPSFGGYRGAGHGSLSLGTLSHAGGLGGSLGGFGSGSSKYVAPVYQSAKSEGLESASAFSGNVAPPGTNYGFPSTSFSSKNAHAASSNAKPYYVNTKYHQSSPSFGEGSLSYRAPASSHSSLSTFSPGPKYSFGSPSSHYTPKDAYGAASETSYNTIKYSEELKPRAH